MTVIAVCSDHKRVCMGADSQGSNGGVIVPLATSKITRRGEVLFGSDGTTALGDSVRWHMPEPQIEGSLEEWAARTFVPWLREFTKANDLQDDESGHKIFAGWFLVAWRDQWVLVEGRGGVRRLVSDWWAIGSGGGEARGAMHNAAQTQYRGPIPQGEVVVLAGVHAACALDDGCSLPFVVEWTT